MIPDDVTPPSMEEARRAHSSGFNRVGDGVYRLVHRVEGSHWVYKYGSCEVNRYEVAELNRVRLELAVATDFEWMRLPEAVLMEDPHFLAMEYIHREGPDWNWCDYYVCENPYCRRHRIENEFNLEDLHQANVILNDEIIYPVDLGGSRWHHECCEGFDDPMEEMLKDMERG